MTTLLSSSARGRQQPLLTYALEIAKGVKGEVKPFDEHEAAGARRWMRGSLETCVQNVLRADNRVLSNYVATYKHADPQWRPLLSLPAGNPIALELRARHVNVQLRHLVQKGHAVYLITDTQHSVFHPRGLAERSFVTTSMGIKNERLKCHLVHEGPIDAANPHGERGVVAVSVSNSIARSFSRRTMSLERTRRVGAIQSSMGAFDWALIDPILVGREMQEEVFLLHTPTRVFSTGVQSAGIVSSAHIAKHPRQYVTEFEAPSTVVADIVNQLCFFSSHQHELFDAKNGEPLHCMAYCNRGSYPRGVPLEVDLPFKCQMSSPEVSEVPPSVLGTVGDAFCSGAPIIRLDGQIFQGSPEYLYDAGPIHRPKRWWSQSDAVASENVSYYVRDGNLPKLRFHEIFANPFVSGRSSMPVARWPESGSSPAVDEAEAPPPAVVSAPVAAPAPADGTAPGEKAPVITRVTSAMTVDEMPWLQPTPAVAKRVARSQAAVKRIQGVLRRPAKSS